MGISRKLFIRLAAAENWMHPRDFGTGKRPLPKWPWMDIVCFNWIYMRRQGAEVVAGTGTSSEDDEE